MVVLVVVVEMFGCDLEGGNGDGWAKCRTIAALGRESGKWNFGIGKVGFVQTENFLIEEVCLGWAGVRDLVAPQV